jgi:hypothetical protein
MVLVLTGCGSDVPTVSTPPIDLVNTIVLEGAGITVSLKESRAIGVTFKAANGNPIPGVEGATWTTSDPAVLAVDQNGVVEGKALGGPVTLTVSANGHVATATVTVAPASVVLQVQDTTLNLGASAQLSAAAFDFLDAPLGGLPVTWGSATPWTVSVDPATGIATGVASGTAVVTATVAGRTGELYFEVGVESPRDGFWRGSSPGATTTSRTLGVSFSVVFGEVRNFAFTLQGLNGTCADMRVVAAGTSRIAVAGEAFSTPVVPPVNPNQGSTGVTANGTAMATFVDNENLTGDHSAFSFGSVQCPIPPGGFLGPLIPGAIPASTFTATRQ